ncbi:MAG: Hpt domain-containing protein [Pirellulaceae bacterium]
MNLQSSPKAPPSHMLDWEALRHRCLGRDDLLNKALARFQVSFERDLKELEVAADARNCPELARIAHRIKGALLTISANGLASSVAELEQISAGDCANLADQLNEVREDCDRLSQLIDQHLVGAD